MADDITGATPYETPESLFEAAGTALQQGGWSFHRDSYEDFVEIATDRAQEYGERGNPHEREFLLTYAEPGMQGSATLAINAPATDRDAVLAGEIVYRLDQPVPDHLTDDLREANRIAASIAVEDAETGYLIPIAGLGANELADFGIETPNAVLALEVAADIFAETDLQSAMHSVNTGIETIDEFYREAAGETVIDGMREFASERDSLA